MKPFIVLLVSFVVALLVLYVLHHKFDYAFSGRIAMAVMMAFTSIAHFAFANGMSMMLPSFITFKKAVVLFTGVIEIAAAIGLLIPAYQKLTGWMLIIFFLMILPANIYAAANHVDYQKGTRQGNGPKYLWFRAPLQLLFIAWVYFSAIFPV